jgi:beta-glucosidase
MYTKNKSYVSLRAATLIMILSMCLTAMSPVTSPVLSAENTTAAADGNWGVGTLTSQNIWDLIGQMTVEEKDTFIHGSNTSQTPCADDYVSPWVYGCQGEAGRIPGIPSLGIPPLRLSDGPAGARLGHVETAMPAPVGLTATFDRSLAYLFGHVVGRGLRATNQDVWLAPMMNMVNVPTGGRNFETLGEDPYLASEMGVQLTLGSQSEGIIATLKHYVDNDFENGRNSTSVIIDEQTQREMELASFEKSIKQGGAGAVMCSYNRVNDTYSCSNDLLLNQILKGEWGWDGWVMSDWGATHRSQDLISGLDMEQSGSSNLGNPVINYVTNGTGSPEVALTNDFPAYPAYSSELWAVRLDDAVFRILTQMNKAGLLEGTQYGTHSNGCDRTAGIDCTKWIPPRADLQAIQPDEFAKAQLIAEQSATLLKNNSSLLPLTCADLTTGNGIVLMGPTAISTYTGGGGSAHVRPYDPVESSFDALIAAATAKCGDAVMVSYVPGYDLDGPIVPSSVLAAPDPADLDPRFANFTVRPEDAVFAGQPGLLRQQITRDAVPSGSQPVLIEGVPGQLDTTVNDIKDNMLPAGTAWRWTGVLTAPSDGTHTLRVFVKNQASAQLFIDGLATSSTYRRINLGSYPTYFPDSMSNSYATATVANKTHDPDFQDGQRGTSNLTFTAGQRVYIDLRLVTGETKDTAIQFRWVPTTNNDDQIAIAEAAAAAANKTLYFAYNEGTEGSDRGGNAIANGLLLAGNQNDVITAVAAASPNTVVVLNTGDPVFMPWAANVNAILQMWYPGQMGGPATANVVLGNVNPSGKTPVTFPDALAPIGQRFPQDTQPAPCADNTGGSSYYGQGNQPLPGNPGNCPLYPGIYTPGFLGTNSHSFRTINFSDQDLGGVMGNGIFQGYRWYDVNNYEPLFPFGHGLSYTTFEYRNLVLKAEKGGTVRVSFIVQNKGDVAGTVVPQVYVGAAPSIPDYAQQAVRALRGFDRVELRPHEAKRVEITLDPRSFQYWDEMGHAWTFQGGMRTIWVGDSSRDLRLSGVVTPIAP